MQEHPREAADGEGPQEPERPVSLDPDSSSARPDSKPLSAALERIGANSPKSGRYRLDGEIARGGMGVIQKVWDANLRRSVARKLLGKGPSGSDSRQSDPRSVGRFLEEAQVTAQLEHPGIVPVHELGLDAEGKLYFTMRLVRGEDLHKIFEHVKTGTHGWNRTRALHVVLRVCEAMSFAHRKGVLHRDLKPANVMVGRFGEVYVMDWGLARVLGERETKDVRIAPEPGSTDVRTDRGSVDVESAESPLVTMDGDVVGTPAYMSPEQAHGELAALGPATDVYSVGAMLYHLLAGQMPYVEPGTRPSARAIWYRVMERPPAPLTSLVSDVPPELLAIVERAMAREVRRRYLSMEDLAEDLRAYLEQRVVRAYRTGALVELSKWVQRNRLTAAALAALMVVALGSGYGMLALENLRAAEAAEGFERRELAQLAKEADDLWPIHPDTAARMQAWLQRAEHFRSRGNEPQAASEVTAAPASTVADETDLRLGFLENRLAGFQGYLAFLRDGTIPEDATKAQLDNELLFPDHNRSVLESEIAFLQSEIEGLRRRTRPAAWSPPEGLAPGELQALEAHHKALEALTDESHGLRTEIRRRLALSTSLAARTLSEPADAWREAIETIADPVRSPLYGGLRLSPQIGLVPLGPDVEGGLWAFWHVLSGERPERDAEGRFLMGPETGIVLLLVPGGDLHIGAQDKDPSGPNYFNEEPGLGALSPANNATVEVHLAPYFLSKFELTQGQWIRMTGENPSEIRAGDSYLGFPRFTRAHPVETISWFDAERAASRYGLTLPTEAQWERAARAGTTTKYAHGSQFAPEHLHENLYDKTLALAYGTKPEDLPEFDDGHAYHAPVGTFPANPWGFHDLGGNISEWCADWYGSSCERGEMLRGTGEHIPHYSITRAVRGTSYYGSPDSLHAAYRTFSQPHQNSPSQGVRLSRGFE